MSNLRLVKDCSLDAGSLFLEKLDVGKFPLALALFPLQCPYAVLLLWLVSRFEEKMHMNSTPEKVTGMCHLAKGEAL